MADENPLQVKRTRCRDGVVISTINLDEAVRAINGGMPLGGGIGFFKPFETAVIERGGRLNVTITNMTEPEAMATHRSLVEQHDAAALKSTKPAGTVSPTQGGAVR